MANWDSVAEDFGSVGVDYANLHSENLLAKSDFTDEHKDELVQLGEKLGVSVDSSLEVSEMIDSLNETPCLRSTYFIKPVFSAIIGSV